MPFGGIPSRGCNSCRTRKVKCDEAKPACARCTKRGDTCCYRNELELKFHNQTDTAAKRAKDKWRSRTNKPISGRETDLAAPRSNYPLSERLKRSSPFPTIASFLTPPAPGSSPYDTYNEHLSRMRPSLPRSPNVPVDDVAISRFFLDYVMSSRPPYTATSGFFEYLPALYAKSSSRSCLHSSVVAVALANYSCRFNNPEIKVAAASHYGQSVKRLNTAILSPEEARSDETMLATLLLGLYELVTCLFKQERPRISLKKWSEAFKNVPTGPRLHEIIYHSTELLGAVKELRPFSDQKTVDLTRTLHQLMVQMQEAERELVAWTANVAYAWHFHAFDSDKYVFPEWSRRIMDIPGRPPKIDIYNESGMASGWNQYRCTRIKLNETIMECADWIAAQVVSSDPNIGTFANTVMDQAQHKELREQSNRTIIQMVDDISSSVFAHCLGAVNGDGDDALLGARTLRFYMLMFPVFVVISGTQHNPALKAHLVESKRMSWLKQLLTYISQVLGISQAGAFVDHFFKED